MAFVICLHFVWNTEVCSKPSEKFCSLSEVGNLVSLTPSISHFSKKLVTCLWYSVVVMSSSCKSVLLSLGQRDRIWDFVECCVYLYHLRERSLFSLCLQVFSYTARNAIVNFLSFLFLCVRD
jgi:hypothetical protein